MTKKRLAAVLVTMAALLSALAVAITSTFESEPVQPQVDRFAHPWTTGTRVIGVMESSATYIATVRYVDPVRGFYIMDYNDNSFWRWSFADVDANIATDIRNGQAGGGIVLLLLVIGDDTKVLWEAMQ